MGATSRARRRCQDRGAVTVEAAIALCGFVAVLALVLAGLSAVLDQIRCTDAAGEAARLVARGELQPARHLAERLAPAGAVVRVSTGGYTASVSVTDVPVDGLLPGVRLTADAVAVLEPRPPVDSTVAAPPPGSGGEPG